MKDRPKLIQALSDLAEIIQRQARGRRAVEAMDIIDAIDGLEPKDDALPRKIADILAKLADLQRSIAKDHRSNSISETKRKETTCSQEQNF